MWSCGPKGLLSTYRDHLHFHVNPKSGVLSVHSDAYTAPDSLAVLQRATAVAEKRLLRMHRQQSIAQLGQARHLVHTLSASLTIAQQASDSYLQKQKSLYPGAVDSAAIRLMNTLEAESAKIAAQREALARGAAHSPLIGNLDAESAAIQQRIHRLRLQVPKLSAIFGHYRILQMQAHSLQEQLKLADAAYIQAQIASVRPWYTLHVLSPAQKPLGPSGPDRKAWIFWVLVGTLLLWSILR